jgi:hypothetical protein
MVKLKTKSLQYLHFLTKETLHSKAVTTGKAKKKRGVEGN